MNTSDLTEHHGKAIKGVLHCFDRLVLFGTYKSIGWSGAMGRHLQEHGVRLLDHEKTYANALRLEVAGRVKAVAAEGRPRGDSGQRRPAQGNRLGAR